MNIHHRQSNKQVFFSLEFVNILLQMEAKAVKNASSLLEFSGHSELENGLLLPLEICYTRSGEKLLKYLLNSSSLITFFILVITLSYEVLILRGEI